MNRFMTLFGQIWLVGSILYQSNLILKIVMLVIGIAATVWGIILNEE